MNQPNFAATPKFGMALINTANTNTDGTGAGSFPSVFAAGANGSRIDTVKIKAIVAEGSTQSADSVRLWITDGVNKRLFTEVLVPAGGGNISATVANFETTLTLGLPLPTGYSLLASTHLGTALGSYHVSAAGGDF